MTVGADRKKTIVLTALLVIAAVVLWRNFGGPGGAGQGTNAARSAAKLPPDPLLRLSELDRVRSVEYRGSIRNLFQSVTVAETHPTVPVQPPTPQPQPVAPAPQGPPPLPLKFYGFATESEQPKKVFLQLGDEVYVVTEGETIEHHYLIQKIDRASVTVQDLTTQQVQTLPLLES